MLMLCHNSMYVWCPLKLDSVLRIIIGLFSSPFRYCLFDSMKPFCQTPTPGETWELTLLSCGNKNKKKKKKKKFLT